jgi:hypothetical protein
MALRTPDKQAEHDNVILASYNKWGNKDDVIVYQNPNSQKNCVVAGSKYPDIVVLDQQGKLFAVEEVETDDTVTAAEAPQWAEYSKFGVKFNLIVPAPKRQEAEQLIAGIPNIRIRTYTINGGEVELEVA